MKVQVLQENLSKAIGTAIRFTSTRMQLPVLANLLLSAKNNKLHISATNLEISINITIGAKITEEGSITIPAKVFFEIVNNLVSGQVELKTEKEQLNIVTGSFNSLVLGMNPSDFPSVPDSIGKKSITLNTKDLMKTLSQVLYAVSVDETRPVLTGALFNFKKDSLVVVATDGFRLSQKKMKISGDNEEYNIIIPRSVLSEIPRMGEEDNISFSYKKEDKQVVFKTLDAILSSRVIEGDFPDYEKIIPKSSDVKVDIDKDELSRSVKLASVFARDSANIVKFSIKKDAVDVNAESQYFGSQKNSIDAKVEGGPLDIAFNYKFLEDYLHSVEGESIGISFTNANAPGVFSDPKDNNYLHLIMPVKI